MAAPTVIGSLDHLLAAGKTLATLADPNRDLLDLGGDVLEIGATLCSLGKGMRRACEAAEETRDRRLDMLAAGNLIHFPSGWPWTRDEIDLARDNELKAARETAARRAKRALVSLQAVIVEIGGE